MSKELLISRTLNEWRAVLMDNGEIIDFLMDRLDASEVEKPRVGNIYKGKVLRVLPGCSPRLSILVGKKQRFYMLMMPTFQVLKSNEKFLRNLRTLKKKQEEKEQVGEVIPDELSTLTETMEMLSFNQAH